MAPPGIRNTVVVRSTYRNGAVLTQTFAIDADGNCHPAAAPWPYARARGSSLLQ